MLWCDVGLRFVTPVQPLEGEGGKLLSHRRVALRYLRTDLLVDVMCRWPWDACVSGEIAPCHATPPLTMHIPITRAVRLRSNFKLSPPPGLCVFRVCYIPVPHLSYIHHPSSVHSATSTYTPSCAHRSAAAALLRPPRALPYTAPRAGHAVYSPH